jgi:hypothetical protein
MNAIYKFIAGRSKVTPFGLAAAVLAAVLLRATPATAAAAYFGILLVTLIGTALEPPV